MRKMHKHLLQLDCKCVPLFARSLDELGSFSHHLRADPDPTSNDARPLVIGIVPGLAGPDWLVSQPDQPQPDQPLSAASANH